MQISVKMCEIKIALFSYSNNITLLKLTLINTRKALAEVYIPQRVQVYFPGTIHGETNNSHLRL